MNRIRTMAILFILFITSLSYGATYYVDALYGRDSNSGTSTSSPWKTIAKVNSITFKPGDNIFFKRGSTWKETLTIRQSGTSSARITYGAYGSGNLPVIDGSNYRSHGVYMKEKSYINIQNFKVQNTTHGAVRVNTSRYVTVQNSEMYITGRAGVFIESSVGCIVKNNRMTTPSTYYNVQTDGIYAQRNTNVVYDGNHIVISNQHTSQHCDAIQFYLETSAVVKNNYVEQKNTKGGNAQGIYASQNYGTFKIFNNVAYGMYTTSGLLKFQNSGTSGKAEIVGNTVYGGKGALVRLDDPYIIFKNNIVVTTSYNPAVFFDKSISSKSNVNYNLYKNSNSSQLVQYVGRIYSMSSWKSAGFDGYGINADPKFKSISSKDFTLVSGSPALNKGLTMSSPYNVDKNGRARPYASRSDMGAFEMPLFSKEGDSGEITGTDEIADDGSVESDEQIPEVFDLAQNFPNPFNPVTTIRFSIPEVSNVVLKVYDITGSEVAELLNDVRNIGRHEIQFDASGLASGTYIYVITAKDFTQTKKMVLLK
jgi:hypothetical protein